MESGAGGRPGHRPAPSRASPTLVAAWLLGQGCPVPDEELIGRTPEEMLVATVSHRKLAAQRLPGELKLRVGETLDGYHTAVEIVTDDMPFLVDSVTGALAGELDIHLLVHPVVVVRREVFGALEEVRLGVEPDEAGQHDVVESWIRIETDRVRDEATLEEVRR